MPGKHLPYTDFDIAGIVSAVNRYKEAGLRADYDPRQKAEGLVRVIFANPIRQDGSFVAFDVHKLAARRGWFGDKAYWVIQLWSREPDGVFEMRGCVSGAVQGKALSEAEKDLQHGFLSVCDFDLAVRAGGY